MMQTLRFFSEQEGLLFPPDTLQYFPDFLESKASLKLLDLLQTTVPWRQPVVTIHGKPVRTPRLTAWYGDSKSLDAYAGSRLHPLPWTPELLSLKEQVTACSGGEFNSVLLNYYRDGRDSVAWHSDNECALGSQPLIASVSLGEERKFDFRKKEDHGCKYSLRLGNGSLLVMQGSLQRDWEHRIPKSTAPMIPRINLTFRRIG